MWHLFCYCNKLLCFLFIYTGLFVCLFVYLKIDFFIAHKSDCFTYHKKNFWAFDIEYDDLYGSWSPFLPHLALNPCPFPSACLLSSPSELLLIPNVIAFPGSQAFTYTTPSAQNDFFFLLIYTFATFFLINGLINILIPPLFIYYFQSCVNLYSNYPYI